MRNICFVPVVVLFGLVVMLSFISYADDVKVQLDSNDGTTGLTVLDSTSTEVSTIDSDGNAAFGGGVRIGSMTKNTVAGSLVIDGQAAIGWPSIPALSVKLMITGLNYGISSEGLYYGVKGSASSALSSGYGIYGSANNLTGYGVYGIAENTGSTNYGVYGEARGIYGRGVYGVASQTGNYLNYGGYFTAAGDQGYAVYGEATQSGAGRNYGGVFRANKTDSIGVYGWSSGTNGIGVRGTCSYGVGVSGEATAVGDYKNYGGFFRSTGTIGYGAFGLSEGTYGSGIGGKATAAYGAGVSGEGSRYGVTGYANGSGITYGGYFTNDSTQGRGIYAKASGSQGYAVIAESASDNGYAFYGTGRIQCSSSEVNATKHVYDIAETILCEKDVEEGDVVVINPDRDRTVMKCGRAEDEAAAGVISTRPWFSLGSVKLSAEDRKKGYKLKYITLAGQVPCKVDASYGEVKRGDWITTSPTPGYGMRVKDRARAFGKVIGKALQPLKEGKGSIIVFVNLI